MAMEEVQKFLAALDQDEGLATRADDAFVEALHGVAAGAGYDFSEDDLRSALDGAGSGLSDEELDGVAGGVLSVGVQRNTLGGLGTSMDAATGGFVADTVYGGGTSSLVSQPGLTRFGSFSRNGFSR